MTNGGAWSRIFGGDGMQTHIHPTNSNRVYCSTQPVRISNDYDDHPNLFISNDGGNGFNNFTGPITESAGWVTPYELKPSNPNIVIAGFQNIWEYDNGWTQLSDFNSPTIDNVALAPSNDQYIYFSAYSSIHKTTNYGETWENISDGLPTIDISGIEVNPDDPDNIFVSLSEYEEGEKVYQSTDGGETWTNYSFNLPNVPANCLAHDGNGGVYVGTDLGVFFKSDELSNWQTYGDNLPIVAVRDLDILPNNNIIRAGTYGRSIWDSPLYTPIETPPVVDFVSDVNSICEGQEISFSDFSFNAAPEWNWSFEGGTPATSTDPNPTVVYNQTGTYEVSLTMTNAFGTSTETKSTYIFVLDGGLNSIPFQENFEDISEFPNSEWFIRNENNNVTWALNTEVGHSGGNSIYLDNNEGIVGEFDEIISHPFDLTGGQETVFSYWYAHAQRTEDNQGKLKVYFSSNCGDSWEDYFVPTADQWDTDSETISSQYWGPDFRFRFQYKNDGGNVLYLDDINIDGFVGIGEYALGAKSVFAYPNPANDILNVRLQQDGASEILVRNVLGQVVKTISLKTAYGEQQFTMDISDLKNGSYQMEVISEQGIDAIQVVVKR